MGKAASSSAPAALLESIDEADCPCARHLMKREFKCDELTMNRGNSVQKKLGDPSSLKSLQEVEQTEGRKSEKNTKILS